MNTLITPRRALGLALVLLTIGAIVIVVVQRFAGNLKGLLLPPVVAIVGTLKQNYFHPGSNTVTVTARMKNGQVMAVSRSIVITTPSPRPTVRPSPTVVATPSNSPTPTTTASTTPSAQPTSTPLAGNTSCLYTFIDETPPPRGVYDFNPEEAPAGDYIIADARNVDPSRFALTPLPDDFASPLWGDLAYKPYVRRPPLLLLKPDGSPIVPYVLPHPSNTSNYTYITNLIKDGLAGPFGVTNLVLGPHVLTFHGAPTGGTFRLTIYDRFGPTQTQPITYVPTNATQTRTNILTALQQVASQHHPEQGSSPTVTIRSAAEFEIDYAAASMAYTAEPRVDRFAVGLGAAPSLQGDAAAYVEITNPTTETAWKHMVLEVRASSGWLEAVELPISYNKKRGGTGRTVLKPIADIATLQWRGYPPNPTACPS